MKEITMQEAQEVRGGSIGLVLIGAGLAAAGAIGGAVVAGGAVAAAAAGIAGLAGVGIGLTHHGKKNGWC